MGKAVRLDKFLADAGVGTGQRCTCKETGDQGQ